ncbi:MAG: hypothetical protein L3K10_01165 [Thermoplasmata archaeon]|nr:hypothetical protein [Thermoplasmata archaeon]
MTDPTPSPAVLLRLLAAAGYRVQRHELATTAVRIRDRRAVVLSAATRSPAELDSLFPVDSTHRTIIYDDDPGPVAREIAADRGIETLDPSTLGPALGELLLPSPSSPAEEPTRGPTLETPFSVLPEGVRIVRPRIGRSEAQLLVGADGPGFTLRLVPFFVAPYRVRPASPYGEGVKVIDRTVAVHGVSKHAEIWEEVDRELVSRLEIPHQFIAPELTASEAAGIALEAIRRHHTIHVDHTEQHGGALVIETRRVPPGPDDIRIGPLQLIYLPHWYAEGSQGRVVLDAVTGHRNATPPSAR